MIVPDSRHSIPALKSLDDEKGIALVTCIVILAALAMLGAAAILSSQTNHNIANNETVGIQALYAAEAGLSMAIAKLNQTGGAEITEKVAKEGSYNIAPFNVKINGKVTFEIAVTIEYNLDSGICGNRIVYYNKDCGYDLSPFQTGGFPVYLITSKATKNNYSSKIRMELTRQVFNINIEGALTANGPVDLVGAITVDGRQHDKNGSLGGVCNYADLAADETGVYSEVSVTDDGNPNLFGIPNAVQIGGASAIPSTPWEVLDISESEFKYYFNAPVTGRDADGTLSGYTWTQGSFGTRGAISGDNIGGSGILVVHNPDFESEKWKKWMNDPRYKTSNCVGVDGGDETWCADYNADESRYSPATLGNISRGTFKGLVIADLIDRFDGIMEIHGAAVSLTPIESLHIGSSPVDEVRVLFSCEALELFTAGLINHKLSWQKLY